MELLTPKPQTHIAFKTLMEMVSTDNETQANHLSPVALPNTMTWRNENLHPLWIVLQISLTVTIFNNTFCKLHK